MYVGLGKQSGNWKSCDLFRELLGLDDGHPKRGGSAPLYTNIYRPVYLSYYNVAGREQTVPQGNTPFMLYHLGRSLSLFLLPCPPRPSTELVRLEANSKGKAPRQRRYNRQTFAALAAHSNAFP